MEYQATVPLVSSTPSCGVDPPINVEQIDERPERCFTQAKKTFLQHTGMVGRTTKILKPPPGYAHPLTIIPPCISNSMHDHQQYMNAYGRKRSTVLCANCGGMGHIYKNCNHPIISYGVICYRLSHDTATNKVIPEYLMVQRKDSLSYVEFIRGRYNIKSRSYILDMFALMTDDERQGIAVHSFEKLWQDLWCKNICDENKNFSKEYKEASEKFEILKKGYYIKNAKDVSFCNIETILRDTISRYNETEWGFPKGRRNINECDINCAVREFKEETGIPAKSIQLCNGIKPLEEVFSGSNMVRYKHVYYIARMINETRVVGVDPHNKQQCKEIKSIRWFDYETAQSKIRDTNVERKELFRRLNQIVLKTLVGIMMT